MMRENSFLKYFMLAAGAAEIGFALWAFYYHYMCMDHAEHIHAAWLVWQGQVPYRDFFEHHNPLFWYVLAPFVAAFYKNALVLYAARVVSLGFYIFMFAGFYKLCREFLAVSKTVFGLALLLYFLVYDNYYLLFELQPDAAQLARDNIRANGLSDRAQILCADLRAHRTLLPAGSFDLVVANPPYFAAGSGYTSPDPMRAHARDERTCTMQDICAAMAYLTRWGASAALVHRPERLSELLCTLTAAWIEPKRLRTVAYKADAAPNLVLVEARRGGKPGLTVSPPLALCTPDGADSDEICRIYHRRTQP